MRLLPTLMLALLLVSAGCNGFLGTNDEYATVAERFKGTPTPTEVETNSTPSDTSLPPAVSPGSDDEVDERSLYLTHDHVLENWSLTWRTQQVITNTTGTILGWSTVTVWTNGTYRRDENEIGGANPEAVRIGWEFDFWTNGSVTVSRQTLPNGTVERRVSNGTPSDRFIRDGTGRNILEMVLTGSELQYVGIERRNDTTVHILAGTSESSRLTVRVTSEGVIRSFVYRTDAEINGRDVTVTRRFRLYDVETTTVKKPEWAENPTG